MDDSGTAVILNRFEAQEPRDSWVVDDVPYVSLHFLGALKYAK